MNTPGKTATRYVSVIGSESCDEEIASLAREVGAKLAEAGCLVVTGGLGGVMESASEGASEAGGTVIAVIPGTDRSAANPHADFVVCSGVGHARNLAVVASGDVVIAVGGEWGTLSEIGLARCLGHEVVLLSSWKLDHEHFRSSGLHPAKSAQDAVDLAMNLCG